MYWVIVRSTDFYEYHRYNLFVNAGVCRPADSGTGTTTRRAN